MHSKIHCNSKTDLDEKKQLLFKPAITHEFVYTFPKTNIVLI
jgi:hypothetical protein